MNSELKREYQKRRAQGYRAQHALNAAHVVVRWREREGYVFDGYECDPIEHPVRLRIEWDESYDDSYIDTWTDISESQRAQWRAKLQRRIELHGVVGIIGEYWTGVDWEHADSCWGFIGDEWSDSGYDVDIMDGTLAAHDAHLVAIARAWEASRPDMYQGAGS